MNIMGVIPARYNSTRFPGKPLADICGKPMIWWVYNQAKKVEELNEVYVATDDIRIKEVCETLEINVVMTSADHKTHLDRLYEVSKVINADFYVNINGDEPLIESDAIKAIIPQNVDPDSIYIANLMTTLTNPIEAVDFSKIKIATDIFGYGLYMARSPIPYPKGNRDFEFKKFVGVQCFTRSALEFCYNTDRGPLEAAEDIDEFRFLENGQKIKFMDTVATTISVDTRKDLEEVRKIIKKKLSH